MILKLLMIISLSLPVLTQETTPHPLEDAPQDVEVQIVSKNQVKIVWTWNTEHIIEDWCSRVDISKTNTPLEIIMHKSKKHGFEIIVPDINLDEEYTATVTILHLDDGQNVEDAEEVISETSEHVTFQLQTSMVPLYNSLEKSFKQNQKNVQCGHRDTWSSADGIGEVKEFEITQDYGFVGSLDESTGIWTAPVDGVYFISWSKSTKLLNGGRMQAGFYISHSGSDHFEELDDVQSYSRFNNGVITEGGPKKGLRDQGGKAKYKVMHQGDRLQLRIVTMERVQEISDIIFCVSLYSGL